MVNKNWITFLLHTNYLLKGSTATQKKRSNFIQYSRNRAVSFQGKVEESKADESENIEKKDSEPFVPEEDNKPQLPKSQYILYSVFKYYECFKTLRLSEQKT